MVDSILYTEKWIRVGDGSLQRDQTVSRALADRLGAVAHSELGVERGDVELDRMFADVEFARDHLVRKPMPEQVEHLALTRGQRLGEFFDCRRRLVEQPPGQGLREDGQALGHPRDGGTPLPRRGIGRYDAPTPQREGA